MNQSNQPPAIDIWRSVVDREYKKYLKFKRSRLKKLTKTTVSTNLGENSSANCEPSDKSQWLDSDENIFGIALSGGGIRSATLSMGFLKVLNELKLLRYVDYLSTVSGGGYTGAYIQTRLWCERNTSDPFLRLFDENDIKKIREGRSYLTANGFLGLKFLGFFRFASSYIVSTLMNSVWLILLMATLFFL